MVNLKNQLNRVGMNKEINVVRTTCLFMLGLLKRYTYLRLVFEVLGSPKFTPFLVYKTSSYSSINKFFYTGIFKGIIYYYLATEITPVYCSSSTKYFRQFG